MPFSWRYVLISSLVLVLVSMIAYLIYQQILADIPFSDVIAFYFALVFASIVASRLVNLLFSHPIGVFAIDQDTRAAVVWKLQGFLGLLSLNMFANTPLVPPPLRGLVLRACGAKIGHNVMIGGKVIEPFLVEIGNNVLLGEDCIVSGHLVENKRLTLAKVTIGDNVTVGANTLIYPGVEIADNALVASSSVVLTGTRIGPGELWAGNPARRRTRTSAPDPASHTSPGT
jgi:acetyltransferase-like isoleucine patch superfamily enzyme